MLRLILSFLSAGALLAGSLTRDATRAQGVQEPEVLDAQVKKFLDSRRGSWHDLNVPEADGRKLHDLIVERKFRNALEIGTSTGHSGIWIAWGLSKTGGRLITVEIDRGRHEQALANFRAAGLAALIDARLGDAHELVPALPGPFDFVFCDADKDWYGKYFEAVLPKLSPGGCFAAHNISERGYGGDYSRRFLQQVRNLPGLETTLFTAGGGMSITCRTR